MVRLWQSSMILAGCLIVSSCGGSDSGTTTGGTSGGGTVQPVVTPTPKKLRFLYTPAKTAGMATVMTRDPAGTLQVLKDVAGTIDLPCTDPTGTFVFSATTLHAYRIDPATAELTELAGSPLTPAGLTPRHCAFTPSGQFVYVSTDQNAVLAFALNAAASSILPVTGSPFQGPGTPASEEYRIVVEPQGKFVYTSFNGPTSTGFVNAFAIAPTGTLSVVSGSPFALGMLVDPIAADPLGRFLYAGNRGNGTLAVRTFAIDHANGSITQLADGMCADCSQEFDLASTLDGQKLYLLSHDASSFFGTELVLFTVGANGQLTFKPTGVIGAPQVTSDGRIVTSSFSHRLLLDTASDALYMQTPVDPFLASDPGQIWQYRINPDGTLTDVAHVVAGNDKGLAAASLP